MEVPNFEPDAARVLREGFFPTMTTEELKAVLRALETDDPRLIQGSTTSPPPLDSCHTQPCMAGCFVSYPSAALAGGFGVEDENDPANLQAARVGNVEEEFAKKCFQADKILGEPAACRFFLNWFDDVSRDTMRKTLIPEVAREIQRRS